MAQSYMGGAYGCEFKTISLSDLVEPKEWTPPILLHVYVHMTVILKCIMCMWAHGAGS